MPDKSFEQQLSPPDFWASCPPPAHIQGGPPFAATFQNILENQGQRSRVSLANRQVDMKGLSETPVTHMVPGILPLCMCGSWPAPIQ